MPSNITTIIKETPDTEIEKPKIKKKVTILEPNEESEVSEVAKSSSKTITREPSPKLETPDSPNEITVELPKLEKGKS